MFLIGSYDIIWSENLLVNHIYFGIDALYRVEFSSTPKRVRKHFNAPFSITSFKLSWELKGSRINQSELSI